MLLKISILALINDLTNFALRFEYRNFFEIGLYLKRGIEQTKTERVPFSFETAFRTESFL